MAASMPPQDTHGVELVVAGDERRARRSSPVVAYDEAPLSASAPMRLPMRTSERPACGGIANELYTPQQPFAAHLTKDAALGMAQASLAGALRWAAPARSRSRISVATASLPWRRAVPAKVPPNPMPASRSPEGAWIRSPDRGGRGHSHWRAPSPGRGCPGCRMFCGEHPSRPSHAGDHLVKDE